jgi:ABC-type nickel/cobalt efflux system permease component RcnA
VALDDRTFPGTVGWKAMQALPGSGTAVRTSIPRDDPTGGLRAYPKDLLSSPRDVRHGSFAVRSGSGTLDAPGTGGAGATTRDRSGDGLAGVFERAAGGDGVLLLLLLAAFGWGALHALSPGHGKTMVAAYLVGTRGTARDALLLGATVTVTHTIGVFALGFVTLALSAYLLPEQLYPWLQLASGLLVLGVGAAVLRARARRVHHHHHHHHHHERLGVRSLVAMGASAGLLPCPSALVVLLSAIAQHQVGLGLVLIVAFSTGLAATLVALGLAVISAGRLGGRMSAGRFGRYAAALPTVSAALIVVVGCVLTAQSLSAVAG